MSNRIDPTQLRALVDKGLTVCAAHAGKDVRLTYDGAGGYQLWIDTRCHRLPSWVAVTVLLSELDLEWRAPQVGTTGSA
jgi:hypothetical protein